MCLRHVNVATRDPCTLPRNENKCSNILETALVKAAAQLRPIYRITLTPFIYIRLHTYSSNLITYFVYILHLNTLYLAL